MTTFRDRLVGFRRVGAALATTIVLGLFWTIPTEGDTTDDAEHSHPATISPEEAVRRDAQAYADAVGVTLEQAIERLETLERYSRDLEGATDSAGARFAGLWIEHVPELRLTVRLTGGAPAPPQAVDALSALGGDIDIDLDAEHSMAQLVAAQEKLAPVIFDEYPEMGFGIDAESGSIELRGPTELSAQQLAALAELGGAPVSVMKTPPLEPGHTYGGRHIAAPSGSCTTGFTTVNTVYGTKGVLTAGHCANGGTTATYHQNGSTSYQVVLQGKRWDANQDFSWWKQSAVTHPVYPTFFDGSQFRDVLGVTLRSQMQGQPVCHYGIQTGYSCGFVDSVNYNPGSSYCGDPNFVQCASVWVAVGGSSQKCWFGDSGGPYFWGSGAWGLYSGQAASGPGSGQCFFTVMQSQEALAWDGTSLAIYVAP